MSPRLVRSEVPLTVGGLRPSPLTTELLTSFDAQDTPPAFYPWVLDGPLPDWSIGLIVGASGTGKSTLLREWGEIETPTWEHDLPIAEHFSDPGDAWARFNAVGLNSVPTWAKPYRVLSTGERFRADLARQIGHGAVVDEFTSTVSRTVASSASRALRQWVNRHEIRCMVLATCHFDVIEWLDPDWIINTDVGSFSQGALHVEKWWLEHTREEAGHIRCVTSTSSSTD